MMIKKIPPTLRKILSTPLDGQATIMVGGRINTRACGIPSLPTKPSSQQKLSKKKNKDLPTYNLAYLTLWWRRMDREGVKDALALKTEHARQKCAAGMRTFLSLRKPVLETDVNVKTGSIIYLDQEVECCETVDVTKGRHHHPDVLQEHHPLSESHPRIMSGKRVLPELFGSPIKRLRTEGPSTYNLNTLLYIHSDEPSVSKTSKSYQSAAGITKSIESERNKATTSSIIMKKESDVPHMAVNI